MDIISMFRTVFGPSCTSAGTTIRSSGLRLDMCRNLCVQLSRINTHIEGWEILLFVTMAIGHSNMFRSVCGKVLCLCVWLSLLLRCSSHTVHVTLRVVFVVNSFVHVVSQSCFDALLDSQQLVHCWSIRTRCQCLCI